MQKTLTKEIQQAEKQSPNIWSKGLNKKNKKQLTAQDGLENNYKPY